jgi:hypothetical protein
MYRCKMGAIAIGLLVAAACSTTSRMVVPQDVSKNLEVIEVTDRSSWSGALADESFVMGPYQVTDVDRDWDHSSQVSVFDFSSGKTEGGYTFKLKSNAGALTGQCTTEAKETGFDLVGGVSFENRVAKLGCRCLKGESEVTKVVLQAGTNSQYSGTIESGETSYAINALYEREGTLSTGEPSGYRVDGDGPVGAVEVLHPGRVWLAKSADADARLQFACLFAGLMLYKPPSDD